MVSTKKKYLYKTVVISSSGDVNTLMHCFTQYFSFHIHFVLLTNCILLNSSSATHPGSVCNVTSLSHHLFLS